ncbi:sigma-54-dependent transcriptional regulator [Desulfocurvibacter africanus]|uniref:Two component, sigma54 specific, transcriptional regulator, Fis family n=1 Tax=Desulfocurvibacter africanus subsp. africanus str. Walvis Bay TaxID=690850 RepID=F3Z1R2_DESAF|nr:sigma-54 dependent transcriptional regulator [Desulfocurvibacter africanus]EGJ51197.1 two component, sigma54 specific, transcriptional regulator, Fis family [Desulfocurvibacter africanus subsp. africanus str. Walvis Bay]
MKNLYNVLVVDDEESILKLFKKELSNSERNIHTTMSGNQARALLQKNQYDVILLDIRLPDADGIELLMEWKQRFPDVEIIMITGHGNIDTAVEAMKIGAYDYVTKPFHLDKIELLIERAYQRACLQRENRGFRHSQSSTRLPQLVGRSAGIEQVRFLIRKVAPTEVPVLITGESGVGKDVVARTIHALSPRAEKPLIVKNCATLEKTLARSELFGHLRGSFTGATENRDGLMTFAHSGTLFLDEIGELPLEVQASLLRVLESKAYRRVGEKEERKTDIRLICATNRNLAKEVEAGRFHDALFHRINVFSFKVPALRERAEDIPLLVEYFLGSLGREKRCSITDRALECLMRYDWPGNIRELKNVIERSIILSDNGVIMDQALPPEMIEEADSSSSERGLSLDSMERDHISKVLALHEGNRQKTAEVLGIGRKTLYRKIEKYKIQ